MKQTEERDDNELLRLMLTGDEDALVVLYRRRQGPIFRFAYQMSGSVTLAEDVTQEVFLFLMRDAQVFDPERGSLNSFLLGVARNYVLRRLKGDHLLTTLPGELDAEVIDEQIDESNPLDDLTRAESIESVRKAVLSLPERYREVVVLCDLQEMSYVEAAEVLECAIGTVRSRLHRARALLLNKLRPVRAEPAVAGAESERCFA